MLQVESKGACRWALSYGSSFVALATSRLAVAFSALGHWGARGASPPWPGCSVLQGQSSQTGNVDFDR